MPSTSAATCASPTWCGQLPAQRPRAQLAPRGPATAAAATRARSASKSPRAPSPATIQRRPVGVRQRELAQPAPGLAGVDAAPAATPGDDRGRRPRPRRRRRRSCRRRCRRGGRGGVTPCRSYGSCAWRRRTRDSHRLRADAQDRHPERRPHADRQAGRRPVGRCPPPISAASPSARRSQRADVAPEQVEHVVMGTVLQAGQGQIPSRQAQIKAGIPMEVSSETINKVCASGMRAVGLLDQAIRAGDVEVARRRRHGVDVQRAVPAARRALRLPHGRRQGARRDGPRRPAQPVQRQADVRRGHRGRRRARDDARRPGPLGAALATTARSPRPTRGACPRRSSR